MASSMGNVVSSLRFPVSSRPMPMILARPVRRQFRILLADDERDTVQTLAVLLESDIIIVDIAPSRGCGRRRRRRF